MARALEELAHTHFFCEARLLSVKTLAIAAGLIVVLLGAGWLWWDRVFCPTKEATRIVSTWLGFWDEQPAAGEKWQVIAAKVASHLAEGDLSPHAGQEHREVRYQVVPGCLVGLKQHVLGGIWGQVIKEAGAIPCFEYVRGVNTYSHRCKRSDSRDPAHW